MHGGEQTARSCEQRAIFHLSFPVVSLPAALEFYQARLGASLGRTEAAWADVILFGHQLTLHDQPDQVLPQEARGGRHFGAILDRPRWEAVRDRLVAYNPALEAGIRHRLTGEPGEHVKLLLEDPDANLIEIKAYRNLATVAEALTHTA